MPSEILQPPFCTPSSIRGVWGTSFRCPQCSPETTGRYVAVCARRGTRKNQKSACYVFFLYPFRSRVYGTRKKQMQCVGLISGISQRVHDCVRRIIAIIKGIREKNTRGTPCVRRFFGGSCFFLVPPKIRGTRKNQQGYKKKPAPFFKRFSRPETSGSGGIS